MGTNRSQLFIPLLVLCTGLVTCAGLSIPTEPDLHSPPVMLGAGNLPWGVSWIDVPAEIQTETGVAPVIFRGSIYLFSSGEDRRVGFTRMDPAGVWNAWSEIPGKQMTDAPLTAAVLADRLYLFARAPDNGVSFTTLDSGAGWSGWRELQVESETLSALSVSSCNSNLFVFARGSDHQLYWAQMAANGGSQGWHAVPGDLALAAAPAAVCFRERILVFAVSDVGHPYLNSLEVGGRWTGWREVPGRTEAQTVLIDRAEGPRRYRTARKGVTDAPLSAVSFDGDLYLFAKGVDEGRASMNTMDARGNWAGWREVPGGGKTGTPLTAAASPSRGVYVFRQAAGKGVVFNVMLPRPGRWTSIGPSLIVEDREVPMPVPILPWGVRYTLLMRYRATGRLAAVAVHPKNPQVIYVGSPGELGLEGSGLWKTTDGGKSWKPIADDLRIPGDLPTLAIAAIAIDPSTDPERVYVATTDSGIFRSDDAGQNWVHPHSGDLGIRRNVVDGDVTFLLIDPRDPKVLYLTTRFGVQRSADRGSTWQVSKSGQATSLVMDPLHPQVLYAGFLNDGVYKTETGGLPPESGWQTTGAVPTARNPREVLLAISRGAESAAETVYALYRTLGAHDSFVLARTQDGTAWTQRWSCSKAARPDECEFQTMAVDPFDENFVYLGGPLFWVSADGGSNFDRVPQPGPSSQPTNDFLPASGHGDYKSIVIDPLEADSVYAVSDGGIYRSSDRGQGNTWEFIGEGLSNTEIYDIALAATDPTRVLAGTQDNGTILYGGSTVWQHIFPGGIGGDGASVAIDPADADSLYFMGQYQNTLVKSTDGGGHTSSFADGLPSQPQCAAYNSRFHVQVHPSTPSMLLAPCGDALYLTRTSASPPKWSKLFTSSAGNVVRGAFVDGTEWVFAGTQTGRIFRATTSTTVSSSVEVFARSTALSVSDIEVEPTSITVYASFAPSARVERDCTVDTQQRIVRLTRPKKQKQKKLRMDAVDITGDLPGGLCVNSLVLDPHDRTTVYAGTTRGVYRGRETESKWSWDLYIDGMPAADVRDLEVHPVTGQLYAATYGRGVFRTFTGFPFPWVLRAR